MNDGCLINDLRLGTGSTLLNLALSDSPYGGFGVGTYNLLIGDSDSGKSWTGLSCFAEAARDKRFDDYRFIHDNPEDGTGMDFAYYFGQAVAERVEAPHSGGPSETLDEWLDNVHDALHQKQPCIYVTDSIDVLDTAEEGERFEERKGKRRKAKAAGKDADLSGSYGTARAKMLSAGLRQIKGRLATEGKSILIVISQSRDAIGVTFGSRKTRAGGRALKFYATTEMWSSVKEKITKKVRDETMQLGIRCQMRVTKNHQTGKMRTVDFPIYYSYGIADTLGCIEYLIAKKRWSVSQGTVNAGDFGVSLKPMKLARHIDDKGLHKQLQSLVGDVWDEIEEECALPLERRYQ